jgi:magnesium chelatase family protein
MFVMSFVPYGSDGVIVRIEADIRRGIPGIDITGLAAGAVREAKDRVKAAFRNSGYNFPNDRILINLAPAGVKKDGAALDLPIALAVAAAAGIAPAAGNTMVLGELELSGRLRPVRGTLAAAAAALADDIREFVVPAENRAEAEILAGHGRVAGAATLGEAIAALELREKTGGFGEYSNGEGGNEAISFSLESCGDFSEVRGQARYKRALEIAAAGGHNLLVFGPPGAGKTMLARRLPSICAPLDTREAVAVTKLHSLAGIALSSRLITLPPFRSPHHSASAEGILGGGKTVRPGEISLAHFGTLFLDEAPEFKSNVLQALREPLEDGVITVSRAEGPVHLPADFQLVLAANPCPCGKLGTKPPEARVIAGDAGCLCSSEEINRYWKKLGGALLDRVEIRVPVRTPEALSLAGSAGESSAAVRERVTMAVAMQRERLRGEIRRNAGLRGAMLDAVMSALSDKAKNALGAAVEKLGFSGRAYHSVIRTGRTIADLDGKDTIEIEHILEAVQHRRLGDDPYDMFQADIAIPSSKK